MERRRGLGRPACTSCGGLSSEVPARIGACRACLTADFESFRDGVHEAHASGRLPYGLPVEVPGEGTNTCRLCGNRCSPREGEKGYCGLREVQGGRLRSLAGTARAGMLDWYHDPLPTNCCADFVCPAGTDSPPGWREYAYTQGPEKGYRNLAVFYRSCSMGCLYCQNWHYRLPASESKVSAHELAAAVDGRTSCVCFFGGDPSTQAVHALRSIRIMLEQSQGRVLRVCFETNGRWDPVLLRKAADLSLRSGGCIKFDLKAWSPEVHYALTGFGPELTRKNFEDLIPSYRARPEPPFLIACTLLVPGYVDEQEVGSIARWLAALDPSIPYSLLAFHPQFMMDDLPMTSRRQAKACLDAATDAGLQRVRVGNLHLLQD